MEKRKGKRKEKEEEETEEEEGKNQLRTGIMRSAVPLPCFLCIYYDYSQKIMHKPFCLHLSFEASNYLNLGVQIKPLDVLFHLQPCSIVLVVSLD